MLFCIKEHCVMNLIIISIIHKQELWQSLLVLFVTCYYCPVLSPMKLYCPLHQSLTVRMHEGLLARVFQLILPLNNHVSSWIDWPASLWVTLLTLISMPAVLLQMTNFSTYITLLGLIIRSLLGLCGWLCIICPI